METEMSMNAIAPESNQNLSNVENEFERGKRPVKLTAKALMGKLETLLNLRKAKLS